MIYRIFFDSKLTFHLLLTARKNEQNSGLFPKKKKKKKKSEIYINDGMVKESPFHLQIHSKC